MNYLKKQGQASGVTGPAHCESWVATLGRYGKESRDERKNKKYRLTTGNLTKRAKRIYKKISNI
jgi:hypothetical protein